MIESECIKGIIFCIGGVSVVGFYAFMEYKDRKEEKISTTHKEKEEGAKLPPIKYNNKGSIIKRFLG